MQEARQRRLGRYILERIREQPLFFTLVCVPVITVMLLIASRIAIVYEYYDFTAGPSFYAAHAQARVDLASLTREVLLYRGEHKALPARLIDTGLKHFREEDPHPAFDAAGQPVDPWGRPYLYQPSGEQFDVKTFGRDGVPGGHGLDADLSGFRYNPAVYPTLAEFVADRTGIESGIQWRVRGMTLLCTGAVALTYGLRIHRRLRRTDQKLTVIWLLKTTAVAGLVLASLPAALIALFLLILFLWFALSFFVFCFWMIYTYWLGDPSKIPPMSDQ
jgi:general secretion pathway protein G